MENKNIEQELVELYLKADKNNMSLVDYISDRFSEKDLNRYAELFDKYREGVKNRLLKISDSIENLKKISKEDKSILSINFAHLYSDDVEERTEIIYELETKTNQIALAATLASYLNKKSNLLEGAEKMQENFHSSAKNYRLYMEKLQEAKRTKAPDSTIKYYTTLAERAKAEIKYVKGYAKPQVKAKMDKHIDLKITELFTKLNAKPVVKEVKIKKPKR